MSWRKWILLSGVAILMTQTAFAVRESGLPFKLVNRFRVEYDDNYDEVEAGKRDEPASWKVIEELELAVDFNMRQTFLGINLRPNITWWENRPGDSTDFHVYADVILNHNFSRRVRLGIRDSFRRSDAPALIENGETYRDDSDYDYNMLDVALSVLVRPKMYVDVKGGYALLRYEQSEISKRNDYNKYIGSARLRYQLVPETELSTSLNSSYIDYSESDLARKSQQYTATVGVEHMFSPNLMGSVNVGGQRRENEDAFSTDETSPYGDLGLTILPSPATRITFGGNYTLLETDVYPYSSQQRMRAYASVSYDVTAKITLSIMGSYNHGDYNADSLPANATVSDLPTKQYQEAKDDGLADDATLPQSYVDSISDKVEKSYLAGGTASYKINRINWLEVGWRYTKMDSDLRDSFARNVWHAGWKVKL